MHCRSYRAGNQLRKPSLPDQRKLYEREGDLAQWPKQRKAVDQKAPSRGEAVGVSGRALGSGGSITF